MIEKYPSGMTAKDMVREMNNAFGRGLVVGACFANLVYGIIWYLSQ